MSDATPILMPQLGNTMEEGTIVKWLVKEGDRVKAGDILFEVETDKATIEVEAEQEGRIARIVVGDGGTIEVKQPVAFLGEGEVATPAPENAGEAGYEGLKETRASLAETPPPPAPRTQEAEGRVKASPAARKAAEVLGVALDRVGRGSGPDGRILREDVEAFAASVARTSPPPAPSPSRLRRDEEGVRTPMSKMRRAIARNLAVSKQTIPHWYTRVTVDVEAMLAYYRREKALYPCSLNDVIVEACGRVIMEMPMFRSQADGDEIVEFPGVNIGLAVGMDEGLVVPVVRNVDGMNLKGIAAESRRVIENARQGKLEGVGEGVFTISNLGMFGVEEFAAIINPPEASILAVGAVREAVVVKDGAIKAGKVCTMTLCADHRLIDGVAAAKFVGRLKEV
ncbi:MAG TPA: dihydrolipoamide acetyltransferase family protein, partial [Fimbriimonas sp.]